MRLPPDVLTLVLLANTVLAQNSTTIAPTTRPPAAPLRPHPESTVDGWGEQVTKTLPSNCDSPAACTTQLLVHVETSVTGFETLSTVVLEPEGGIRTTPVNRIEPVTTSTPSLVNIHTELAPMTQERVLEPSKTPASPTPGERPETSPAPGGNPTPGNSPAPGDSPTPSQPQATSTPNPLLMDIVSHIGIPVSSLETESKPTDSHLPTTSETDLSHANGPSQPSTNVQFQQATEADPGPSVSFLESVPTMTAGGQVTLGSVTLTLTPGLSSVLGDGATATYVAITTDDAGQTLITVSSSGTAVTATITDAPATLTKPVTGFETSITTAALLASADVKDWEHTKEQN
ncbi:hypothetical protein P171DRAFT_524610 [Karstenula rhodostoma CBS 690.94]|uniref:Uncharacterized protein n=1 Tax=Karstenula rhodostoma CBS 690.94 TaxID=1392251 RepID=A0A9P4PCK0_9PLEO|nr:hypothetical protein P171DRAFT_524610 [Karstenula rhodostoma CBS 690.94]